AARNRLARHAEPGRHPDAGAVRAEDDARRAALRSRHPVAGLGDTRAGRCDRDLFAERYRHEGHVAPQHHPCRRLVRHSRQRLRDGGYRGGCARPHRPGIARRDRGAADDVHAAPPRRWRLMKLPPARVDAFLRRPDPEIRAVLLYGPDAGLVRERADLVARTVCPDPHDPFRVAELTGAAVLADPARLVDEAAQISLMGGDRVIRVRDAGDALSAILVRFLADRPSGSLTVLEAGDLPGRSSLRRAFDDAPIAAAIGCYPDSARDLAAVIRESLAAHRIGASRDAVDFLVEHLGNDRLVTRSELEKLSLYAGDGGRIELDDARAAIADAAALALDDVILAAA